MNYLEFFYGPEQQRAMMDMAKENAAAANQKETTAMSKTAGRI